MKAIVLLLVLLMPFSCSGKSRIPDALHEIQFSSGSEWSKCSAYAVGKRTIMTVAHCNEIPDPTISIDGKEVSKPMAVYDDKHDHIILVFSSDIFKDYIKPVFADVTVGEKVFFYGNPTSLYLEKQYREGYVSGTTVNPEGQKLNMFILPAASGDSGSLIFDKHGHIVGMVSLYVFPFEGSIVFAFTPEQLDKIQ